MRDANSKPTDPIETIPTPETVRTLLAESLARTALLRKMLRLSYEKQGRAARGVSDQTNKEAAYAS